MIIRNFEPKDGAQLLEIHKKYYEGEFSVEEFMRNFIGSFAVADEHDKIISVGGVRTIAESVIVTDKSFSARDRRQALLHILHASLFIADRSGYDQLHAFVQDEQWLEQLKRFGFKDCKGKPIFIQVR